MEKQTERAQKKFDAIADDLTASTGAKKGKMFGQFGLTAGGKAAVCLFGDSLSFKLNGTDHARALKLSGAQLWDPSGRNRPFKDWVQVPYEQAKHWPDLARAAVEFVGGLS